MSRRPIDRPLRVAPDLSARLFEDFDINLFDLFIHAAEKGEGLIRDRTFRGCRLQGPAILLVSSGVSFEDVNFGDSRNDIRNLVLRPVGNLAMGTIPLRECSFEGCEFYNVGFTGDEAFLALILSIGTPQA